MNKEKKKIISYGHCRHRPLAVVELPEKGSPGSLETRSEHDIYVALSNSHQKSVRSYFTRDQVAEDTPVASGVAGPRAG